MSAIPEIKEGVSLAPYVTLRAGGKAERFAIARSADELADLAINAQKLKTHYLVLGWGSNVLPSDSGVKGLVILNASNRIVVAKSGEVLAESGCSFQELFLKTAQSSLVGLSFAVGIPGTLGGALVSNAGAYRSNISTWVTGIEIVYEGVRKWVEPAWMKFSYRDSVLRSVNNSHATIVRVALKLEPGDSKRAYDEAREFQRQRISKQPPGASAGSFFKNITDKKFAMTLDELQAPLKEAGVVPAGFLIERCGLKGHRIGGATLGVKHANFILNTGRATATEIRRLAEYTRICVQQKFGVELEEEVLYLGDWNESHHLRSESDG